MNNLLCFAYFFTLYKHPNKYYKFENYEHGSRVFEFPNVDVDRIFKSHEFIKL